MELTKTKTFFTLFLLSVSLLLSGCFDGRRGSGRGSDALPVMPPLTHPLTREYIGFAVVTVSFTHLLSDIGPEGVSQTYLRRGTVVRIIERRQFINRNSNESWVLAEANYSTNAARGWLNEAALEIYDTESRALTASNIMGL
jgi:hypothetical protein